MDAPLVYIVQQNTIITFTQEIIIFNNSKSNTQRRGVAKEGFGLKRGLV